MEKLNRNQFVLGVSGGMNLCMKLREKMETHYQKNYVKEQTIKQYQPEASPLSAYNDELSPEEKENIFKDVYRSINMFEKLLYEAKKKSFKRQ